MALRFGHRLLGYHFFPYLQNLMIDNTNRNFKGQLGTEEVLCFCRKHWIVILHYLVGLPILWFFVVWFAFFWPRDSLSPFLYQTIAGLGVIAVTYLHHLAFLQILNYYLQILIVTNYRIISMNKTIFFRDSRNNIDVKEIQDVIMEKDGFLQTILNYGDIKILLSSVAEPICIRCVPNPDYHFRKIHKTKREYIHLRQLEKEAEREHTTITTQSRHKPMPWEIPVE